MCTYVIYKPWPRTVYVRYTPAMRKLIKKDLRDIYITNKLLNIAYVYLKIHQLDMAYNIYI